MDNQSKNPKELATSILEGANIVVDYVKNELSESNGEPIIDSDGVLLYEWEVAQCQSILNKINRLFLEEVIQIDKFLVEGNTDV